MGTNYDWQSNICKSCGRSDELHIGKQSGGWEFAFRAHSFPENPRHPIRSKQDWWEEFKKPGVIVDEYGKEISVAEFKAAVEASRGDGQLNHFLEGRKEGWIRTGQDYMDSEGWSFSSSEFS